MNPDDEALAGPVPAGPELSGPRGLSTST
ncbi:MAG: hypothetical protein JWR42_2234, partial [Marmoricola sp.]|nr:hypothetical protein [Marmoricola sp.]